MAETTQEIMKLSETARMFIAEQFPHSGNFGAALDAIHRLTEIARRAAPKPTDAELHWGLLHDPLCHAAYTHGLRLGRAEENERCYDRLAEMD